MLARGIAPEAIHMVKKEMEHWADGFTHPAENVEETVDELRMNPLIPKDVPVHGLIFHPRTGEIEVIVNGYTQMKQYYENKWSCSSMRYINACYYSFFIYLDIHIIYSL